MKKIVFLIFALFVLSPLVSSAAELSFVSERDSFSENEEFVVDVYIDTKEAIINAIEGKIVYSPEFLEFKELREGNSVINFWIDRSTENVDGQVSFSGITPGGFFGAKSYLFSVVFKAKTIGSSTLGFESLQILQNDGHGTNVASTGDSFEYSVVKAEDDALSEDLNSWDTVAPEIFQISLGQDSSLFDNKYFIVFSTVDKGTGIDHYEIREGEKGDFKEAVSPYLLNDQRLSKKVFVKAIDKNGNERIVTFDAQESKNWYENYWILAILLVLIGIFFGKKVWSRFVK